MRRSCSGLRLNQAACSGRERIILKTYEWRFEIERLASRFTRAPYGGVNRQTSASALCWLTEVLRLKPLVVEFGVVLMFAAKWRSSSEAWSR
jgi:hypothetical protein